MVFGLAAEHHAAPGVNVWGFDRVVIEAPTTSPDCASGSLHGHGKMGARSEAEIDLLKMIGGLVAAEFARGELRTKSGSKQAASLAKSALLNASAQECMACSISAMKLPRSWARRFLRIERWRSMVTPSFPQGGQRRGLHRVGVAGFGES